MALDSTNVLIGSTGAAYVAPLATAAPTTSVSVLNAAFKDLGYLSDDGVTESYDDSTDEITAWQGAVVVRRVISKSAATLAFTMIESKADVLRLFHKGTATALTVAAATVSNKALTSNVATLTTAAPHTFAVGQSVVVAISDAVFDGTFIITSVTSTTFTYAKTNANVTSGVASGTATLVEYKLDVLAPTADRRSFVLDVLDGTRHIRLYVASGEVTDRGDVAYANNGNALSYPVTITCYPINNVVMTKFSDSAAWA